MSKANNPQPNEQLEELTLEYINRLTAGEKVDLAELKKAHPELADELSANLMEYLLVGRDEIAAFEQELDSPQYRAEVAQRLNDPARRQSTSNYVADILAKVSAQPQLVTVSVTSLYEVIDQQGLTPPEVARTLNISSDILLAFEQRRVRALGIPRLLLRQLAEKLQMPVQALVAYLGQPTQAQAQFFAKDAPNSAGRTDFATLIAQSGRLSAEQKNYWQQQARQDALGEDDLPTT